MTALNSPSCSRESGFLRFLVTVQVCSGGLHKCSKDGLQPAKRLSPAMTGEGLKRRRLILTMFASPFQSFFKESPDRLNFWYNYAGSASKPSSQGARTFSVLNRNFDRNELKKLQMLRKIGFLPVILDASKKNQGKDSRDED